MAREYLFVDNCGYGEAVETVCEGFPQFDVESTLALIVKPIDSVDTGTFVVSAKEEEIFRVFYFVGQKQADALQALFS